MTQVPQPRSEGASPAQLERATTAHKQGRLSEAERLYSAILVEQPHNFDALHRLGLLKYQQAELELARGLIERAIAVKPASGAAWSNLGSVFLAKRCYEEALMSYDRAIALLPDEVDLHFNRGNALLKLRRFADALSCFDRVVAVQNSDADVVSNRAAALLGLGRLEEALGCCDQALLLVPTHIGAIANRGHVLVELKRPEEALACYDHALQANPDNVEMLWSRANALRALTMREAALSTLKKALSFNPDDPKLLSSSGQILFELRRLDDALICYDRLIAIDPEHVDALSARARILSVLSRAEEALVTLDRAITIAPDDATVHNNRGNLLMDLARTEEALASYDRAIALRPDYAVAYNNRGIGLFHLGRVIQALESYDRATALAPDFPDPYVNRGNALSTLARFEDALASYDRAITLNPSHAQAFSNRGNTLRALKRLEEALASHDRAIALRSDYADAHNNRGTVLSDLKRSEEALASYDKVIALRPENAQAHNNRGAVLRELNRLEEALASHDRAIALKLEFADAHYNRGVALWDQNRFEEALGSMEQTLALEPKHSQALANGALLACMTCNWPAVERIKVDFLAQCQVPEFNGAPFPLLALCDDPAAQRAAAQAYIANQCPPASAPAGAPRFGKRNKLRLGYLSADFREHPVAFLIAELIELHDRSQFEVYAYSATANDSGTMGNRLKSAFDFFIDVRIMSDGQLDRAIRQAEIDILVDLGGHTSGSRIQALARRPAPLQVTYLGYPGTSGAPFIDYAIVDAFVVPPQEAVHFSEKLAYLPECFQVNDRKRAIAERTPTRTECGLPDGAFVFCGFNSPYKINAGVFDTWMRLLTAVPNSVLWLSSGNEWAHQNLVKEARARGVDPGRLIFAPRVTRHSDHLARQRLADLFLDSWPYNAHVTASDALRAGLPIVTYSGRSFAARVAGSLLHSIGLPELVTDSPNDYELLALKLAQTPDLLREVRQRVATNIEMAPLFNAVRFTHHLEAVYCHMWERYTRGERPETFVVPVVS